LGSSIENLSCAPLIAPKAVADEASLHEPPPFARSEATPGWENGPHFLPFELFDHTGTDDFNGDGTSDVLWRNDTGADSIWLMKDGQIASVGNLPTVENTWHIQGTGDFNGDHTNDILWSNNSGANSIWFS
jgi:hypothetical protein